jgi:hypothetical protein
MTSIHLVAAAFALIPAAYYLLILAYKREEYPTLCLIIDPKPKMAYVLVI